MAAAFFSNLFGGDNKKTFKPVSGHKNGARTQLHEVCQATLGSGNMREAVKLPRGEDLNEWLAVNTVDFFNEISLLYGTITEFCTADSCPVMNAGASYEYLWADGVKVKDPVKLSAPEYIDCLMSWVEEQLNDQTLFPLEAGTPFPKHYLKSVQNIFKRLFRVYAHIYHCHFEKVVALGAEAHVNTCFRHYIFFVDEFQLIEAKELEPLRDKIAGMLARA